MSPRKAQHGFSLTELAVSLSVAGVLVATALPQLASVVSSRQIADTGQSLQSALRLARSEALRRDEQVTICPLAAGAPAAPSCVRGGRDWSRGWMVFVDRGQRELFEAGDLRLHVHQLPERPVQVASTASAVSFRATGVQWALASRFNLSAAHAPGQVVCVNKVGRARMAPGIVC